MKVLIKELELKDAREGAEFNVNEYIKQARKPSIISQK